MRKFIASIYFLRLLIIPLLNLFNFKFKWKHDITKRPFYLETFKHKGYWYYGKKREQSEIDVFYKLVKKGDKVLEVGTHIGYITQVFEDIVGEDGQVFVVEPTPESVYYLKKNILPTTIISFKAASNYSGEANFYTTSFGGFTNSLDEEFTKSINREHQQLHNISSGVNVIKVEVDTLDNICNEQNFIPTFLKIDVEGSELNVLKGAAQILNSINALMVEISFDKKEIIELLAHYKFEICYEDLKTKNYFFKKY